MSSSEKPNLSFDQVIAIGIEESKRNMQALVAVYPRMVEMPASELAPFADFVTRYYYDHPEFGSDLSEDVDCSKFNATSVGNLAFLSLNAPDLERRRKCVQVLRKWRKWARESKK